MNREVHVRICERLGVRFPGPTRHPLQIVATENRSMSTVPRKRRLAVKMSPVGTILNRIKSPTRKQLAHESELKLALKRKDLEG